MSQCVSRQEKSSWTPPRHKRKLWQNLNQTFIFHKTSFIISNHQELPRFLEAPPHFRSWTWTQRASRVPSLELIFATTSTHAVLFHSWAERLNTLASVAESLMEARHVLFFGSWDWSLAVCVKNKYVFLSSSELPKAREPNNISVFSLALAFPSSWNCD